MIQKKNYQPLFFCSSSSEGRQKVIEEFVDKRASGIENLTQAIKGANGLAALGLYNERGIAYFFIGAFENALEDFDYVLTILQSRQTLEKELMGVALWGRLLCHAFKSQLEETYDDSLMIQLLLAECNCSENRLQRCQFALASNIGGDFSILPVAKFALPEEKITKWECHDRTKSIADKMKALSELIPPFAVRKIVLFTIDQLAANAHECCERGHPWTICLGPIADAWLKLENTWDQLVDLFKRGISIGAFITGVNNL